MRLHGITKLILFAVALRFVANCVGLSLMYDYLNGGDHSNTLGSILFFLGGNFQEFARILLYIGSAVFIEALARLHSHLQRVRIASMRSGARGTDHV